MSFPRNDFEDAGCLKAGHYSLQVGAPNPTYLKNVARYLEAATKELYQQARFEESLQYGVTCGVETVCKEVANFLTRQYESLVEWQDIFITAGATNGLNTLLKHFFTSEQIMFVENPTYPVFAVHFTKDKLMTGVPIPIQSDGLDLEYFAKQLDKLPEMELTERRPFKAVLYLISTHHNPTGCCYSPDKCQQLVELARKHDVLIICDDVYNTLNYVTKKGDPEKFEPSPLRLYAYDKKSDPDYKGNIVSNGSFAKIVAPGLRMGWYEAPERVRLSLRNTYESNSGGGRCFYISHVVAEALKNQSIDLHVQSLRVAHKARMATVIGVIEENLSKYGVTISHPNGGYFMWVKLPSEVDSRRVLEISKSQENVTFVPGNKASICGDFSNYIRLSIAYYEADELKEAATRLSRSIIAAINEKRKL